MSYASNSFTTKGIKTNCFLRKNFIEPLFNQNFNNLIKFLTEIFCKIIMTICKDVIVG